MKATTRSGVHGGVVSEGSYVTVEGADVQVSIIDRDGWLDIAVDPKGAAFVSRFETREVSVSDTQARLSVRGQSIMESPEELRAFVGVTLANAADRLAHHRFDDPAADVEDILSKLITAIHGAKA